MKKVKTSIVLLVVSLLCAIPLIKTFAVEAPVVTTRICYVTSNASVNDVSRMGAYRL
jgi:hypothetical protein